MRISEILEALGDEEININTRITIEGKDTTIIEKDIMEVVLHRSTNGKTTVADILDLILKDGIIGSTELYLDEDEDDTFDLFQDKVSDEQLQLTTSF